MKNIEALAATILEMLGLDGRVYLQAVAESRALDTFDPRFGLSLIVAGLILFAFNITKSEDKNKAIMRSFWLALPMLLAGFWTNWFFGDFFFDLRRAGWALALSSGLFLMFFKNRPEGEKEDELGTAHLILAGLPLILWPILGLATAWTPVFIILTLDYKNTKISETFFSALAPFLILKGTFLILTSNARNLDLAFDSSSIFIYSIFGLFGVFTFSFMKTSIEKSKLMPIAYILVAAAMIILFKTSRGGFSPIKLHQYTHAVMGTQATVTIWDRQKLSQEASKETFRIFDEINNTLSTYKEDSEISRLNREAFDKKFKCSPYLWENLLAAKEAYEFSDGAFDVTIRPLIQLWNFNNKRETLPSDEEIKTALSKIGFEKIEFFPEEKAVRFKQEGLQVDLGGIAKGYAVDLAVMRLKELGITKAIIDLGGNMYCFGETPKGIKSYKIAIKNPVEKQKSLFTVDLKSQAIATSGNYERFVMIDGKRYPHIVDPRTGWPVDKVDSVTVVSPSALWADILSTTIFVQDSDFIEKVQTKSPQTSIVFIDVKEKEDWQIIKKGNLFK